MKKEAPKYLWNKSQVTDSNLFIGAYLDAIKDILPAQDRYLFYFIAKFYTDAIGELKRDNLVMAECYFERAELYSKEYSNNNSLTRRLIINVATRSRSFYFFKQQKAAEAIELIFEALRNNEELEKNGLDFLLFDRIQQYINLARVYFKTNRIKDGFAIQQDLVIFLLTHRALSLKDLNTNYLKHYGSFESKMRFSLICQVLFDTILKIIQIENATQRQQSLVYFLEPILKNHTHINYIIPEDRYVADWLLLFNDPIQNRYKHFAEKSRAFIDTTPPFYFQKPIVILNKLIEQND